MSINKISPKIPKPVILCILDGWGYNADSENNAIALAVKPNWDRWVENYPNLLIEASGEAVGLPKGQMGNSEVGHMTIGTGRINLQDLPKISKALESGNLNQSLVLNNLIKILKLNGKTCHIMGLISPGGVHSHMDQIAGLVKIIGSHDIPIAIHAFLDGRDTPPKSAIKYLKNFLQQIESVNTAKIMTISGRYYAMDRDKRWDRVQLAFDTISHNKGLKFNSVFDAIEDQYNKRTTDEFIRPMGHISYKGMEDGDALVMGNFRADRVRELLQAFLIKDFSEFDNKPFVAWSHAIGMTEYSVELNKKMSALFPSIQIQNTLAQVLSNHNLKQLHVAETEKYAHVTFFFNGGIEQPWAGEERHLIPSPKVATYDLEPEMSARKITSYLLEILDKNEFDVIIVNYANPDMVGHTGCLNPTIEAIEVIDDCLGQLEKKVLAQGGILLVTADHGNAEQMNDSIHNQPHTSHTLNKVPFFLVSKDAYECYKKEGSLKDIAPTVLACLNIGIPSEMEGTPCFIHNKVQQKF